MIRLKTEEQINRIRESCHLTAQLMERLATFIVTGYVDLENRSILL